MRGPASPLWKGSGDVPGTYWSQVVRNARRRGVEVRVGIRELARLFRAQGGLCAYTGVRLTFGYGQGKEARRSVASLDRIDSGRGYVRGNLQWVTRKVQAMKWVFGHAEFLEYCSLVCEHHRRKARRTKVKKFKIGDSVAFTTSGRGGLLHHNGVVVALVRAGEVPTEGRHARLFKGKKSHVYGGDARGEDSYLVEKSGGLYWPRSLNPAAGEEPRKSARAGGTR